MYDYLNQHILLNVLFPVVSPACKVQSVRHGTGPGVGREGSRRVGAEVRVCLCPSV